jgi:homoserine kinase type II
MAVFTTVTPAQAADWLARYSLGGLVELAGIQSGIENTNYFLTTERGPNAGRFVLTLFEKLSASELPFYLGLMAHLADRGVPAPRPIASNDGPWLGELNGKPAAIVARLPGSSVTAPTTRQCSAVGRMLGSMHRAGADYAPSMPNGRGPKWWTATAPKVSGFLPPDEARLLDDEIVFQASRRFDRLARGPIHADLFRDNILFSPDSTEVSGVIDFYFACTDVLLFDVAVAVNDWCRADFALPSAGIDAHNAAALLEGYAHARAFSDAERAAWPVMLRAGALRFWVSRLFDFHLPRPGEMVHAHDPAHFRDLLRWHVENAGRIALPGG